MSMTTALSGQTPQHYQLSTIAHSVAAHSLQASHNTFSVVNYSTLWCLARALRVVNGRVELDGSTLCQLRMLWSRRVHQSPPPQCQGCSALNARMTLWNAEGRQHTFSFDPTNHHMCCIYNYYDLLWFHDVITWQMLVNYIWCSPSMPLWNEYVEGSYLHHIFTMKLAHRINKIEKIGIGNT